MAKNFQTIISPFIDFINRNKAEDCALIQLIFIKQGSYSKSSCFDNLIYSINYLMKNQGTPFQQMGFQQESDLQDIFKLLSELDKPKTNNDLQQSSNKSHLSKRRQYDPPISQQSEPMPVSISQKFSPQIKRKYTSAKLNDRVVKIQPLKNQIQNSLNHQSNISAESVEQVDSQMPIENDKSLEKQNFIIKNSTEKFAEKNKTVAQLQRQLEQYHSRYNQKENKFIQEKNRQKEVLAKVLKQGNLHAFKYNEYLQHINAQHKKVINDEVLQKHTSLLKTLKEEQSKYKPKKKIKNTQTMSLSDQQEHKLSEFMQKQKKHYFSVIGAKIQKQRQKYQAFSGTLNTKKMSIIDEQRLKSLSRVAQMKDILPLCIAQSSNKNIQEILAVDLQRCHQVRFQSIKFNPTTSNQQRSKIFDIFLQQIALRKKILSNHHMFNQKSTIFVPLSNLCLRDDEILLINQCNHSYFSLQTFLNRIQLGPPQQQFHIVRYIIRICLKAIQDLNSQMKHDRFVILPFNLYFNQKWQLKLSNVVLNQLLFHHFRHILHEDDYYYFPPQEKADKHSFSLWSLGILVYFLCFAAKPFPKYQPYHWNSREEFFMFNQLQITQKSAAYDKCKDFIMYCLTKKGTINFNQVCSQPFLTQVK